MSLPRSVAEVLKQHVALEVEVTIREPAEHLLQEGACSKQ